MKTEFEKTIEDQNALLVTIVGDNEELDKKQYEICEIGEKLNKPLYVVVSHKASIEPLKKLRKLRLLFTIGGEMEDSGEFGGREIVNCIKKDMKRIGLEYKVLDMGFYFH